MEPPSDQKLLEACIAGDRSAWETFVRRFTRYIYYMIQLTIRRHGAQLNDDAVADLHNDVFVALLEDDRRRLRSFEGKNGCSVRSWLRIITIRRTLDHLRRQRVFLPLAPEEGGTLPSRVDGTDSSPIDPLEALLAAADERRRRQLDHIAMELSPTDRLLLTLIYEQKMDAGAVAAALNLTRGAVYTRKNRLIQRLRRLAREAGLLEEGLD